MNTLNINTDAAPVDWIHYLHLHLLYAMTLTKSLTIELSAHRTYTIRALSHRLARTRKCCLTIVHVTFNFTNSAITLLNAQCRQFRRGVVKSHQHHTNTIVLSTKSL